MAVPHPHVLQSHLKRLDLGYEEVYRLAEEVIRLADLGLWATEVKMPEGTYHKVHGDKVPVAALVRELELDRYVDDQYPKEYRQQMLRAESEWMMHREIHGLSSQYDGGSNDYVILPCLVTGYCEYGMHPNQERDDERTRTARHAT